MENIYCGYSLGTLLMSTNNVPFHGEIRKICGYMWIPPFIWSHASILPQSITMSNKDDDNVFYIPSNIIQVIMRQWESDYERLCAMKHCILQWEGSGEGANYSGTQPLEHFTMTINLCCNPDRQSDVKFMRHSSRYCIFQLKSMDVFLIFRLKD